MKNDFKLIGNGQTIRSDEEMLLVDKAVADNAFKRYKKDMAPKHFVSILQLCHSTVQPIIWRSDWVTG